MRVQQINNNQQSFGLRSIKLDDSLAKHASTRVLRAIEGAMTPKIYAMGGDSVELVISATKKEGVALSGTSDYLLAITNSSRTKGSAVLNPDQEIRNPGDMKEEIIRALEDICPEQMRTARQILAAARAKAAALNPKD